MASNGLRSVQSSSKKWPVIATYPRAHISDHRSNVMLRRDLAFFKVSASFSDSFSYIASISLTAVLGLITSRCSLPRPSNRSSLKPGCSTNQNGRLQSMMTFMSFFRNCSLVRGPLWKTFSCFCFWSTFGKRHL